MKYIKLFESNKHETMIQHEDGTGLLIYFGQYGTWKQVSQYCPVLQGYREAGYSDWRIPNKDDLYWIFMKNKSTRDIHNIPNMNLTYWSSSQSAFKNDDTFYCLNFRSGRILYCNKNDANWAFYVRNLTKDEVEEYIMNKNAEKYNL